MQRTAAHYIYAQHKIWRMHYVETDDAGQFTGIYPLEEEIAGTAFYDGLLVVVPQASEWFNRTSFSIPATSTGDSTVACVARELNRLLPAQLSAGETVSLYLLNRMHFSAPELGTDNCSCNGHIQRL